MDPTVWREYGSPLADPTGTGLLDGLRIAVKDLYAVAGHRTGGGNPAWLAGAGPEPRDAVVLATLRAAGAAVTGIAHTDELAFALSGVNLHYGAPPNPAAPDRVTGGSSNGPASAVASGQADIGLGSDTAGSVRVPASCCRLYALRPTHGAVSSEGLLGLAPSFDTAGWITRDAATLRAVGDILLPAGTSRPVPGRLTLLQSMMDGLDEGVAADVRNAATRLAGAWQVELTTADDPTAAWPAPLADLQEAFRVVQAAEAWALRGPWIETHPGAVAADVEARFRFGGTVTAAQVTDARSLLDHWRRTAVSQLADDAWWVLPAAAGPGHPRSMAVAERDTWRRGTLRLAVPASACGLPSVCMPARQQGDPVGLAIIAGPGDDRTLLAAVERATGRYWNHDDA